jgi:quinol monooxygenase YgiN
MSDKRVFVMAQARAKAEFIAEVKCECAALVEPSRAEKGCLVYDLFESSEEPTLFVFFEAWENMKDLERHLESPHALAFDEKTEGLLAEPERIIFLQKIS